MNQISSNDTTELVEAAVPAAEFTDELSDEALDRATVGAVGPAPSRRVRPGSSCACSLCR